MRFKSLCKAAAAVTLAAAMITASGCNNEKNDNTAEITVGPGDTLAEMTIQIGEETGKIRFKLFPEVACKPLSSKTRDKMDSLKIGNITLPHRAVFGPMAGFTDAPCRRLMAQHGAGFTVSEMVSSRALVYHDHKTVSLLKAEPNGAPYGVQIFGEVPQIMGEAAAAIEEYEFDFLDINMGCPAPKIVSGGAGSKLMLDPDLCGPQRPIPISITSITPPTCRAITTR